MASVMAADGWLLTIEQGVGIEQVGRTADVIVSMGCGTAATSAS